jgi:hypothetical protein
LKTADVSNRRRHIRVGLEYAVILCSDREMDEGRVIDLSLSGARIQLCTRMPPRARLELHLLLPEEPLRIGTAVVRWKRQKDFGVEFVGLMACDAMRLEALLGRHRPHHTLMARRAERRQAL